MSMNNKGKKQTQELGTASIPLLLLRFFGVTFGGLLFSAVYTLTDALFVSWGVGDSAMGSVSVVFPFVIFQGAFTTALGGGAASIVSRLLGKGEVQRAGEVTANAMIIFYITSAVVTVLGFIFLDPLLSLMGVTDELYPMAKQYFSMILAGNVFSTGFSSIIRAEGRMGYSLLIWVLPISANIVLDVVFILVLKWGVKGSALATVISQFISAAMSVFFFTSLTSQKFKGVKLRGKIIAEIFAVGVPSLIQTGSLSIITVILNRVLRDVGSTAGVTTFAYISKILTFVCLPSSAIALAVSPVVGYNYGAGKYNRVSLAVKISVISGIVYGVAAMLFVEFKPEMLMRIFTENQAYIKSGADGLRIIALSFLFVPLPAVGGAVYQALGNKFWALVLYSAPLILLVPMVLFMPEGAGIEGAWGAYVGSNAAACVLAAIKLMFSYNKSKYRLK